MSKEKKSGKLKQLISKALGIESEWKLNAEGHLDVGQEELARLTAEYGADFVGKFEKLLSEESETNNLNINQNQSNMPKQTKLALLCALLAVESIVLSEDGVATLNEEQLGMIESGLKKLQDDKAAAESNLTTANSAKDTAVKALSDATTAMDDLDASVKAAGTATEKVEAIRKKLAEKPGAAATGTQSRNDQERKKVEGADPVNEYVKGVV